MHFKFYDDLMGSAPESLQNFGSKKEGNIQKNTHQIMFKMFGKFT